VTKFEPLPRSAQYHPIVSRYEFARKIDEARETLMKMGAQVQSIQDSLRDSSRAIEQSLILLREKD